MKSKIRKLIHPMGHELETPILVPSYSSKGFAIKDDGKSEISEVMVNCAQFLTEILLVSAYDISKNLIPKPKLFATTETVIIDSGGYEASDNFDFATVKKFSAGDKKWELSDYQTVLNEWPEESPSIIVSFDHAYRGFNINEQVSQAKELFKKYPKSLNDFLIKPFTRDSFYLDIDEIINNIKLLKGFDIIGVTEVELGNSVQNRMRKILKLRKALEESDLNKPIHIFGSLDPITSVLYFLSGADIFDGLTWLRYSYFNGIAVYPSNFGVLNDESGIHLRDAQVQSQQLFFNLASLMKLKDIMQQYITTGNIGVFDELGIKDFSERLKSIIENLTKR